MKIRRYEVLDAMGHYVIREAGNSKASGLIALTCGRSKADKYGAEHLVAQANAAPELLEALKSLLYDAQDRFTEVPNLIYHKAVDAIAKAEGRS